MNRLPNQQIDLESCRQLKENHEGEEEITTVIVRPGSERPAQGTEEQAVIA